MAEILLNGLVMLRIAHASVHLIFPFETWDFTGEGLPGCNAQSLQYSACVFSASLFAQAAVWQLSWATLFYSWKTNNLTLKAILFALLNVIVAVSDVWSAHGADIDTNTSIEVFFSEKMALISVIIAAIMYSATGGMVQEDGPVSTFRNKPLLAQANDVWFFFSCLAKFLTSFSEMTEPIDAYNLRELESQWKPNELGFLARNITIAGANSTALVLALFFLPSNERAGFVSYMILCSTQVFAFMIDGSIKTRMPAALGFEHILAGHAFLVSIFGFGILLLAVAASNKSFGEMPQPQAQQQQQQQPKNQQSGVKANATKKD